MQKNSNDNWVGKIVLNATLSDDLYGYLSISDLTSHGLLEANSGKLIIKNSNVTISNGSYIAYAVATAADWLP